MENYFIKVVKVLLLSAIVTCGSNSERVSVTINKNKKSCTNLKNYTGNDKGLKNWYKKHCIVLPPHEIDDDYDNDDVPVVELPIIHPTAAERANEYSLMLQFSLLNVSSYDFPSHWSDYKETHSPIYWYENGKLHIEMPLPSTSSTERSDSIGFYRFKGDIVNSLAELEQIDYYLPQTDETMKEFDIPVFEDGYTYIIITKCVSHDMWVTQLLPNYVI